MRRLRHIRLSSKVKDAADSCPLQPLQRRPNVVGIFPGAEVGKEGTLQGSSRSGERDQNSEVSWTSK
jgi:hypothetical protein